MSSKKRYVYDDDDQLVDVYFEYTSRSRHRSPFKRFTMNDPDAYDEVAKIKSAVDLRVLCLCQRYVDYGNIITATQSEIASQLGLHQQNVSASMKRLESMGFVRKMGKRGTVNKWALSPRLLFMGKPRDHKVAILKYDAGEDWA